MDKDIIGFWHDRYGVNGYYRMLEEFVLVRNFIGNYPYALEEEYLV